MGSRRRLWQFTEADHGVIELQVPFAPYVAQVGELIAEVPDSVRRGLIFAGVIAAVVRSPMGPLYGYASNR